MKSQSRTKCVCGHSLIAHKKAKGACSETKCQCKAWKQNPGALSGIYNLQSARNLLRIRTGRQLLTDKTPDEES